MLEITADRDSRLRAEKLEIPLDPARRFVGAHLPGGIQRNRLALATGKSDIFSVELC
jgi:hypothetical protein